MRGVRRGRSAQGKADEGKSPEKEAASDSDSDGDVDKSIVVPVRGGRGRGRGARGGRAKQQPAAVTKKAPPKRTTRSSKAQHEEPNEEEATTSRRVFSTDDSSSSQEEDEEDKPPPKGSKGKQPVAQKKGKKNEKAPQAKDNSFEFAVPVAPPQKQTGKKVAAAVAKSKATKKDANLPSSSSSLNTTSSSATSAQSTSFSDASQLSSTIGGLTKNHKKEIHTIVLDCLDECQKLDFYARRRLYNRFRTEFYKMKNPEVAHNWQKYFIQSFWTICLAYFKAPNSKPVQTAVKFIHHVALNMGTSNEKADVGFKLVTHPTYYYVLKLFVQCHMDERHVVRLRVIDIAHQILNKFATDALINENSALKQQLIDAFLERLKDRNHAVRAVAASCLKFYAEDPNYEEVIKRLKYSGRYDPFPEPRKAALVALADNKLVKTRFFYDAIFDPELRVRVEAFSCLANRPMVDLKTEENLKAVLWGLTQEDRCKKVVIEKLIPTWFAQCNNNPLELINHLCIGKKFQNVEKVLNGVFLNNYVETFEKIDVSFLDEHHVIPIDKLTVETVMFWIYLIKKFGKDRIIQKRLLPMTDYMMEYIKNIIYAIHEEHEKAIQDDRDEDGTLIVCLTFIITTALKMGLEEGNRRNMKEILHNILLDSILDEAPLVKLAVDGMNKISDKLSFQETMLEILQLIFEPDSDQTIMDGRESLANKTVRTATWIERQKQASIVSTPNQEVNEEDIAEQANKSSSPMQVEEIQEQKENSPPKPTRKPLTEKQIMQLKDKKCGLAIQRIRLQDKKQRAVEQTDFLEAHRIQKEIEVIVAEENQIEVKMSCSNVTEMDSSRQSKSSRGSNRRGGFMNDTSEMEMEIDEEEEEPAAIVGPESLHLSKRSTATEKSAKSKNETLQGCEEDLPFSQATTAAGVVRISSQNILKGLVMMNRYLSRRPRIAPLIRQFYTEHAPSIFLDCERDPTVRIEVLTFLCCIALIDPEEKRKLMGLFITALLNEEDLDVKSAAFKVIVDMLCKYDIQQFILNEDGIICAGVPEVFNKLSAPSLEMQTMFISLIDDFGSSGSLCTPNGFSIKVEGIIKLLTAGRLTSEHLISDLLCMWTDIAHQGTDIPYNIEIWLPFYTKTSVVNAKLVVKALFISILRLIQPANERSTNEREQSEPDFMKLVVFVSRYLSSSHIKEKDGTPVNLHEELYGTILDHVLVRPTVTANVSLLLVLPKLSVENETTARKLLTTMSHILLKLSAFPQTTTVSGIKSSIEKNGKRLAARYEGLSDILEVNRARNMGGSDEEEDREENVLSDDEEELQQEEENANVARPQINEPQSEDDLIQQSSDVEIGISSDDE